MSKNSLRMFLSYAHRDDEIRRELSAHLAPLRHQGLIVEWTDRLIGPGSDWAAEILSHLEAADLIILLISSDFINSGYCFGLEMKRALERHQTGAARVIPVIARPCHWNAMPFASIQALPAEAKPITTWGDRDSAYLSVVQGVEDTARRLLSNSSSIVAEWVGSLLARRKVVRLVQAFLAEGGFYHGPIDGVPSKVTLREAVRRFQRAENLHPDGLIGPETLRAISAKLGEGASD